MASFTEKRSYDNRIVKASSQFGKNKEICITPFNGRTYVHISDKKGCFNSPGGKFDFSKSKSITFNIDEIEELRKLLRRVEYYGDIFNCASTQVQQQQPQQQHQPQQQRRQQMQQPQQQQMQQPQQQMQQPQQQMQQPQQIVSAQAIISQSAEEAGVSPPFVTIYAPDASNDDFEGGDEMFYAIPVTLPQ